MPEETVVEQAVDVATSLAVLGGAAVAGLVAYLVIVRVGFRIGRADRFAREATARCRWPARTLVVLLSLLAAMPATELGASATGLVTHGLAVAAILAGAWTLLRLAVAVEVTMLDRFDIAGPDNARNRGRQTQVVILRRVASGVIVTLTVAAVLLTFESARTVGTSLLASAGVIGLVVGIAAQPTLGNLVAGIQLAVAEPLSLDDVVVVEGEWGNIEEITLTYVVVRTWDRRRLVLPTSYFMNTPFQNWTRNGSQVIGSIFWEVDHRVPLDELREEFHRQVETHPLWDGDVVVLQVTEARPTVELRGLVTAQTAPMSWDLRCAIREGVLRWLWTHHPEAVPTTRLLEAPAPAPGPDGPHPPPASRYDVRSPGPDTAPNPDPDRTGPFDVVPPVDEAVLRAGGDGDLPAARQDRG
ncbi:mechanosensitive ion channel family protein [Euzebya sp.]|uniref:mechanosensitive ion channel family protein n=1 Tax=Euzebya sp. TaxID=1971409 RepID=UPI003514A861